MIRVSRYLLEHKPEVLIILVMLIVQAYCDLSLPQYTSDIVDIGIEQGGIENSVPEQIRESSFNSLKAFMNQSDIDLFEESYDLNEGIYVLNKYGTGHMSQLDSALNTPMATAYTSSQAASGAGSSAQAASGAGSSAQAASGAGSSAQAGSEAGMQAGSSQNSMNDSLIKQTALLYIQQEYSAIGLDTAQIQMNYLLKTGGKMLFLSILMVTASITAGLFASRAGSAIGRDLRKRIFSRVIHFSGSELDQFSTASLITRSTNDIQQIQMVSVMFLRMVLYAPIIGIGGIFKVITTHTGMTWIIVVAVVAIVLLILILMSVAMPKFKIMQSLIDKLNLISREILTGISVIRAFNRQKLEEERFDEANTDLMKTQLFTNRAMTFMMPAMMIIMNCVSVLIVWAGAKGISLGNLQVGDMIAFITYTMMIVMAFMMLTMMSIMLPRASVAASRIDEVIQSELSIVDADDVRDDELQTVHGKISFKDVAFSYPDAKREVISDISFDALPGQTTAIIGSTGSGKSTLLHLIPRFYDVTKGQITLDGIDIREISQHKLREAIGFVPQQGILFSGTIESNLKFADENISDEVMKKAAEIAQAEEFIDNKSEGYQSHISQDGSNVSGGQRQRLSIARAIAKQPRIFLFDDSFSALDFKTDAALRHSLEENIHDATVIIVAQRVSTIMNAEKIIVLDEGRIAGTGSHTELLKSCPEYLEIAQSQLSEDELRGGNENE